jgi:hypothetical protein
MDEISQRLDRESEIALASLPGRKIQTLMSESADIEVGHSIIEVLSVSIQLNNKKFVVVESDWGDTAKEWLDYHCLSVRIAGAPKRIKYNAKPPKNDANYTFDHLSIHLGAEAAIATIDVLEAREVGEVESVVYDAGFVVTRQDGLRFAIVRAESILGSLQIAHAPTDIEALTAGLRVRARYGA